jgi:DeoR family transcriptional regulator, glycerol-3-phosphate regulon repressor
MSVQRQTEILRAVRQSGSASVAALAAQLGVSTESIRRDIKSLIESGAVLRFHGGIMDPAHQEEPPFQRRMRVNREAKRKIATLVLELIRDGDSLILDNGTTTAYAAEALAARSKLVVVTNSAQIACRLAGHNNNRVFMAGGELAGDDAAAFGHSALAFLRQFEVRCALLSAGAIGASGEIRVFHLFEAEFARAAMAQARETWVIADASKFAREAPVRLCGLEEVSRLITDTPLPAGFAAASTAAGIKITAG